MMRNLDDTADCLISCRHLASIFFLVISRMRGRQLGEAAANRRRLSCLITYDVSTILLVDKPFSRDPSGKNFLKIFLFKMAHSEYFVFLSDDRSPKRRGSWGNWPFPYPISLDVLGSVAWLHSQNSHLERSHTFQIARHPADSWFTLRMYVTVRYNSYTTVQY